MPKRAVLYARQSITKNPEDSLSLEFQVAQCRAYIVQQGWILGETYVDPNTRGWRPDRPEFNAMLTQLRAGQIDVVVVYKLSRFARDLMMQETVVAEIAAAGGQLVSVTESHINNNPMFRQILGAINEQHKRELGDWLTAAHRTRAERGLHHGPTAPYGYGKVDGRLRPDPATSPVVRRIFDWALAGIGCPTIGDRLNQEQITTQTGVPWDETAVRRTLRNPAYAGHIPYRDRIAARDAHEAIVSQEEHDQVQVIMARRTRIRRKVDPSWAEGFVFHACGRRMYHTVSPRGPRFRFRCQNQFLRKYHPQDACYLDQASIYADVAEDIFLALLVETMTRLLPPERVAAQIERGYQDSEAKRIKQRGTLDKRLTDLRARRERLLDLALDGRLDKDTFTQRDTGLAAAIAGVSTERDAVPLPVSLGAVRTRHGQLASLTTAILIAAQNDPQSLTQLLHALDVRLILGGGPPRLAFGEAVSPFFPNSPA